MKKILLSIGVLVCLLASCRESSGEEDAYADWRQRNEAYFEEVYAEALSAVNGGSDEWKILTKWSLNASRKPTDNVVVRVVEQGSGAESPLFTDVTHVYLQLRLMPTTAFPDGRPVYSLFDQSRPEATWAASEVPANGCVYGWLIDADAYRLVCLDGLSTALMQMHVGDHWLVCVPSDLAFGSSPVAYLQIPAHSVLLADVKLQAFSH